MLQGLNCDRISSNNITGLVRAYEAKLSQIYVASRQHIFVLANCLFWF